MTTTYRLIAVLGLGLAVTLIASFGQSQEGSPKGPTAKGQSASSIVPTDQAGEERLAKFLDHFHVRDVAPADQATKEKLDQLVALLHARRRREELAIQHIESYIEQKESIHFTLNQRVELTTLLYKHIENFSKFYPIDEKILDLTGNFQKYMTREDVDAAITFYGSPTEQHSIALQPDINEKLMTALGVKALGMPDADARIKDFTAEFQKGQSRESVDATFAFYASPAGQHMIAALTIANLRPYIHETSGDEAADVLKELPAEVTNYLATLKGSSGQVQPEPK